VTTLHHKPKHRDYSGSALSFGACVVRSHLVPSANRGATADLRRRPYKHMRCCPHDAILSCFSSCQLAVRRPSKAQGYKFLRSLKLGSFAAADGLVGINSPALIADQHTFMQNNAKARLSMTQTPCKSFQEPLHILLIQHDSCMTKVSHQLCSKISWGAISI